MLFLILVLTGGALLFHYRPTTAEAHASLYDLSRVVPYGWWIRNLHYWGGQAMVLFVLLHMARVVLTGAFAPPRRFNWVVGCALLSLTLITDFTGYLLRWDRDMVWAATVVAELLQRVPGFGGGLYSFLTGSEGLGDTALLRFYVLHCVLLPSMMAVLMAYHFWRVRKDGGISSPL